MNCRGIPTRKRIVKEYEVKAIAHIRLLNGQTKRSDAEAELEYQYYVFQCTSKSDNNIIKSILCGTGAAKHFLELTGQKDLPLFDPIRVISSNGIIGNLGVETQSNKWNEETKQLYNAIQWLIICWDIIPNGPIIGIKEKLEHYYYKAPFLSQIKAINTIISKGNRRLTQMIDDLRSENDIKVYSFDLLEIRLKDENITSYF